VSRTAPELDTAVWRDGLATLEELLAIWAARPAAPGAALPAAAEACRARLTAASRADLAARVAALAAAGRLTERRIVQIDLLVG